jgi:hypothetical protein
MLYINNSKNEMIDYLMGDNNANWSYEGAAAIIDYLETLADETGEPVELNRVDVRCQFTEYDKDCLESDYSYLREDQDERDMIDILLATVPTTVIKLSNGKYLIGNEL